MKKFNPEKELNKIRKGNKNKLVIGIITLLLIIAVGSTYALYQIRHTQKLVFNTVGEFIKRDIILSVVVDGETRSEFPGKDDGYAFERLDCDKDGTSATFDKGTWELVLRTNKPNKCTAIFGKKPNEPELYQGLIPVTIDDDGTIKVADTKTEWYNYGEHKWANAVLVNTTAYNRITSNNQIKEDAIGTTLDLNNDILQMYVWIPRFKYQLFNTNNEAVPEQMINIIFEKDTETTGNVKCTYTKGENGSIIEDCKNGEQKADNGDWYTHPAFTFKGTFEDTGEELTGMWFGKFQASTNNLLIKPSITANTYVVNSIWTNTQNIATSLQYNLNSEEVDTHMLKNIDWGAIAYLTQSKYGRYIDKNTCVDGGCEVWLNNTSSRTTGCAADPLNSLTDPKYQETPTNTCNEPNRWNGIYGRHASTTDNIYGIYDLHGIFWEMVSATLLDNNGNLITEAMDFNSIDSKYYDVYGYSEDHYSHTRGHLGDATRETLKSSSGGHNRWFRGHSWFITESAPVLVRGDRSDDTADAGIFASWAFPTTINSGVRVSITAKGTD